MSKKKILFIINPFSGTTKKESCASNIEKYLNLQVFIPTIIYTEYPNHAYEISKEASNNGMDIVVAVGGDGTINEVAKGLVHTNTILAIIPKGSGNGFSAHLKISKDEIKALETINNLNIQTIDTCTVNDQFFINVSGVGFDGYISNLIKNKSKRGMALYFFKMLKAVFNYKSEYYSINIDGKEFVKNKKYYCVAIANASIYGYQFHIAPQASLQDGLLDVVFIKEVSLIKQILSLPNYFTGNTNKINHITIVKAKSLEIKSDQQIDYHYDGEGNRINAILSYKINPMSLKVIAN